MEEKGFFAALFDFSFSSTITPKLVKLLYILALPGAALCALSVAVSSAAWSGNDLMGMMLLPVAFLVFLVVARVYLELIVVLFKIADNSSSVAASTAELTLVLFSIADNTSAIAGAIAESQGSVKEG